MKHGIVKGIFVKVKNIVLRWSGYKEKKEKTHTVILALIIIIFSITALQSETTPVMIPIIQEAFITRPRVTYDYDIYGDKLVFTL